MRGQLTNDVLLSVAYTGAFEPRWSQAVLDEVRRNQPPGVTDDQIDHRLRTMNRAFPDAMITGYEDLIPEMQADDKDKHVLAAAVYSGSDVLVTENTKDFHPPSNGAGAMRIERTSQFLNRVMDDYPEDVVQAMQDMVDRNRREPRTMPELVDRMAAQHDLKGFARQLNAALPPGKRSMTSIAMDGVAEARGAAQRPSVTPEARQTKPEQGPDRGPGLET